MTKFGEVEVGVRVVIKNQKALRAFAFAIDELIGLHEDFPYRPEIGRIAKALRYAAKNMTVEQERE